MMDLLQKQLGPQKSLMPTIKECTIGSANFSETQSQRSNTNRSSQLIKLSEPGDTIKTDNTMSYTISNHKFGSSSFKQSEAKEQQVSQRPLQELQNRINLCSIQEEKVKSQPNQIQQLAGYPTFNPTYNSLNQRGGKDSDLENDIEEKNLHKKLLQYRNQMRTISQGTDEQKNALIRDFFAEKNNARLSQEVAFDDSAQRLLDEYEYKLDKQQDVSSSLQYDQNDPAILQLTESQQNEDNQYRIRQMTSESDFIIPQSKIDERMTRQLEKLRQEKLQLEKEFELLYNQDQEKEQVIQELQEALTLQKQQEQNQDHEMIYKLKDLETQNKELTEEVYSLQNNHIITQQFIQDLSVQRDILALELQQLKSLVNNNIVQRNVPSNSSFFINDRSSLLCDITYDQDSSRNDQSFLQKNRRARSLSRKTCGNSVDDAAKKTRLVDDLTDLLNLEHDGQLYQEILQLKEKKERHEKFLNSLQDMIVKLTPAEAYKTRFQTFIERLLEVDQKNPSRLYAFEKNLTLKIGYYKSANQVFRRRELRTYILDS